jgi:hypothetical protein
MERLDGTSSMDDPWADLVISILSVNQYSLDGTFGAIGGLRAQGLLDPRNLMRWDLAQVATRLIAAGCDRGPFMTNLFALRLCSLGMAVEATGVDSFADTIAGGDRKRIEELLLPVNGIGPKVIWNFFLLRPN